MAGQSWSINIVPSPEGVQFNPDVYECPPGAPLQAQEGDLVSWNNQTDAPHQIDIGGEKFEVQPWRSTTAYLIQTAAPATIQYTCENGCAGEIEVVA